MSKKVFTMVATYVKGNDVIAVSVIDEQYKFHNMQPWDVASAMERGAEFTNLDIERVGNLKFAATNGVFERYTKFETVDNPVLIGAMHPVVLNRIMRGNDTVGFTVLLPNGRISEVTNEQLITLDKLVISNAKVVEKDGKKIVSSIKGNFPVCVREIKAACKDLSTEKLSVELAMVGRTINSESKTAGIKYVGVLFTSTSAALMSQLIPVFEEEQGKIKSDFRKVSGSTRDGALSIQRNGMERIYVVMSLATLINIVKSRDVAVKPLINDKEGGMFMASVCDYAGGEMKEISSPVRSGCRLTKTDNKAVASLVEEVKSNLNIEW